MTAVSPLLTHWRYYSFALSHRFQRETLYMVGYIDEKICCGHKNLSINRNKWKPKKFYVIVNIVHISLISWVLVKTYLMLQYQYNFATLKMRKNTSISFVTAMSAELTLRPRQNGRHFTNNIFKLIFWLTKLLYIGMSPKFLRKCLIKLMTSHRWLRLWLSASYQLV